MRVYSLLWGTVYIQYLTEVSTPIYIYNYIWYKGASWDYFSSESLPLISWGGQQGLLGGNSPNRVPAPNSGNVTSRTPQKFGVRVALPGRRLLAEGGSVDHNSRWIVFRPRAFEGRPPLGKRVAHRITWCPPLLRRSVCQPCQCYRAQRSLASASISLFRPET